MRKMKDSGIAWIGKIPEEWKVGKAKYYLTISNGSDPKTEGDIPVYGSGANSFKSCGEYKEGPCVLVGRKGATLHIPHYIDHRYWNVDTAFDVKSKQRYSLKYYYYLASCFDYKLYISQTTLPGMTQTNYENMSLPIPEEWEQERIANFLDAEFARIDAVIEQTRASIEEYKKLKQAVITQAVTKGIRPNRPMKDSGVEWIGEIRSNYRVYRMKHLIAEPLMYGANESGIPYEDGLPRYIRITDISLDGKLKNSGKLSLTEEAAKDYILADGDVLFARSGATVGKAFIYKEQYGRAAFAGYLIRARVNDLLFPELLFYYTQSSIYEEWKNQIFIQSTIQNIGADRYNQLPVVVPTKEEQEEILTYIQNKTSGIDKLLRDKARLIEDLESYRKSAIFEYVTGKKAVVL